MEEEIIQLHRADGSLVDDPCENAPTVRIVLFRILAVRGQIHYLVKRKRKNRLRASRASTHAPEERLVARRAQPVAVAQRARRCLARRRALARAALPLGGRADCT